MQIERESLGELTARVKVKLEPGDYQPRVENVLNDYRKSATIPGFRKGKVPMALIKKQYGTTVLVDELNKMLQESLGKYLDEEQLNVLGQPIPSKEESDSGDFEKPGDFEFAYDIGLAPEVSLEFGKKAVFTRHTIKVDKKAIEAAIEDHKRRHGNLTDQEVSEEKDLLVGHMAQLDDSGTVLEGGIANDANISIEHVSDKKAKKALQGLKVGDIVAVDPHAVSHGHDDLGKMLNITHDQVHDLQGKFQYEVKEIKRMHLHENNQELWDKVLGKDVVSDAKAFENQVKDQITDQFDRDAEWVFRRRFVVDLLEHINLPMPDEFMKRWIQVANEQEITQEQVDTEYPSYAESLRWQLVQSAVMKATEMRISQEELELEAKRMIGAQYAQYGMPIEGEYLDTFAQNALANEEERRRIADVVIERKVVDDLKTRVTIKEKAVSFDDFAKLAAEVR